MTNRENSREQGKYGIYLRSIREMIWVSEDVYREYYRPIWTLRKQEQKRGNCICPHKMDWLCDGDCAGCEFHVGGRVLSLDDIISNAGSENFTYTDSIVDTTEEEPLDKLCHDELLDCIYGLLANLDDLDKQIAIGIMQGKSERDIAKTCGFSSNSSINWRKKQLLERLRDELYALGYYHS